MAAKWKSQPPEVLEHWCESILVEGKGVSQWERDFVTDISGKLAFGYSLSEKQHEILERIYAEKTS